MMYMMGISILYVCLLTLLIIKDSTVSGAGKLQGLVEDVDSNQDIVEFDSEFEFDRYYIYALDTIESKDYDGPNNKVGPHLSRLGSLPEDVPLPQVNQSTISNELPEKRRKRPCLWLETRGSFFPFHPNYTSKSFLPCSDSASIRMPSNSPSEAVAFKKPKIAKTRRGRQRNQFVILLRPTSPKITPPSYYFRDMFLPPAIGRENSKSRRCSLNRRTVYITSYFIGTYSKEAISGVKASETTKFRVTRRPYLKGSIPSLLQRIVSQDEGVFARIEMKGGILVQSISKWESLFIVNNEVLIQVTTFGHYDLTLGDFLFLVPIDKTSVILVNLEAVIALAKISIRSLFSYLMKTIGIAVPVLSYFIE